MGGPRLTFDQRYHALRAVRLRHAKLLLTLARIAHPVIVQISSNVGADARQDSRREVLVRRRRRIADPLVGRFCRALNQRLNTLRSEDTTTVSSIILLSEPDSVPRKP